MVSVESVLASARRVVVKIGSGLLIDPETGGLHQHWLAALVDDIVALRRDGKEIIIVSSGSIALGRKILGMRDGPLRLEDSQAAAAIGQIALAKGWERPVAAYNIHLAQILITLEDTENRRRYLNARATLTTLLRFGALPVINENDTVATDEIRYGDNDRLAARVAGMVGADCLILLSDVDGLYDSDPKATSGVSTARLIRDVTAVTPQLMNMAGTSRSSLSRGGMRTKLEAGRIALDSGCHMIIAQGGTKNPLAALAASAPCTLFHAPTTPRAARKRWIAGALEPVGVVHVDAGAEKALQSGRSLLPAGIINVGGAFERGDIVLIRSHDHCDLGRGVIAYGFADAATLCGRKSDEFAAILGYAGREEMIHRDDLALFSRHDDKTGD